MAQVITYAISFSVGQKYGGQVLSSQRWTAREYAEREVRDRYARELEFGLNSIPMRVVEVGQ